MKTKILSLTLISMVLTTTFLYSKQSQANFEISPVVQVACYHHIGSLTGSGSAFAIVTISNNNYKACQNAFVATNGGISHDDHDCVITYEVLDEE